MQSRAHQEITRHVLKQFGFPKQALAIVERSNLWQDERRPYRPWHHFDRTPGHTNLEAFKRGERYIRTELRLAERSIQTRRKKAALMEIGRLFHALQDFYAHSNCVELSTKTRKRIEPIFGKSKAFARELKLTGYDPITNSESPPGDLYPHARFSKDIPLSPFHNKAKLSGTSSCMLALKLIRESVPKEDWSQLLAGE